MAALQAGEFEASVKQVGSNGKGLELATSTFFLEILDLALVCIGYVLIGGKTSVGVEAERRGEDNVLLSVWTDESGRDVAEIRGEGGVLLSALTDESGRDVSVLRGAKGTGGERGIIGVKGRGSIDGGGPKMGGESWEDELDREGN